MGETLWLVQGFKLIYPALYRPQEICPGCAQGLHSSKVVFADLFHRASHTVNALLPLGEQRRPWGNSTG